MSDRRVRIYEVGPRDGLQNEATPIATADKLRFLDLLAAAGLREIEATSFVSPKAIPQLADADELLRSLTRRPGVRYPVLVPNLRGLERAEAAGADAIAVFTAASSAFTERNIGMTVDESLVAFAPVLARAARARLVAPGVRLDRLRLPVHGTRRAVGGRRRRPAPARPRARTRSASATRSGWASRTRSTTLTEAAVAGGIPIERIAYHFHDTRGTALANVAAGLAAGVRCFDSASGGTGGCPYAPGAAGNLATEDLVYFLDASGWEHGVRLEACSRPPVSSPGVLGKPLTTKVGQAGGWDPATGAATGRLG